MIATALKRELKVETDDADLRKMYVNGLMTAAWMGSQIRVMLMSVIWIDKWIDLKLKVVCCY